MEDIAYTHNKAAALPEFLPERLLLCLDAR
jgi:hypothetical protein